MDNGEDTSPNWSGKRILLDLSDTLTLKLATIERIEVYYEKKLLNHQVISTHYKTLQAEDVIVQTYIPDSRKRKDHE